MTRLQKSLAAGVTALVTGAITLEMLDEDPECKVREAFGREAALTRIAKEPIKTIDGGVSIGYGHISFRVCGLEAERARVQPPEGFTVVAEWPTEYDDKQSVDEAKILENSDSLCRCGSGCQWQELERPGAQPDPAKWKTGRPGRVWAPPYAWRDDGTGRCKPTACVALSGMDVDEECNL
jgi:hypothetical protein